MKKHSLLAMTILTLTFFFHNTKNVSAVELITNGGFETGFTGWTTQIGGSGYSPWQVSVAGGGISEVGVTLSSPIEGTRSSHTGFCCNTVSNPEFIRQQVTIPAGNSATLTWQDKIQSNLVTYCSVPACGSNVWRVQILDTSNVVLQTLYTFTANGGAMYNSGWVNHSVSLNAYSGQTILIRFSATYTSTLGGLFNGPGRAELDAVSLIAVPVLAAQVSVGGRIQSANGNGIRNVIVSLVDSNGRTRTTKTSSFGYYSFDEVETGTTTISVISKRFTFANPTQVISVTDSIGDLDFTAIE